MGIFGVSIAAGAVTPPLALVGKFAYKQKIIVQELIHDEIVYAQNSKGQEKLQDLMSNGYECRAAINHQFICSKQMSIPTDIESINQKANNIFLNSWFEFGNKTADPVLQKTSETYDQWQFQQDIKMQIGNNDLISFEFARYDFIKPIGLVKIYPGDYGVKGSQMIVIDNSVPSVWWQLRIQKSKFSIDRYWVQILFEL